MCLLHLRTTRCWPGGVLVLLSLLASAVLATEVSITPLISRGAVLQRDIPVRIWGQAAPGAAVEVMLAGHSGRATTDASGRWLAQLDPLPYGGPHRLTATAQGRSAVVEDLLVGEVWLCAGQSNMQMRLKASTGGDEAAATAEDQRLRYLRVPHCAADEPQSLIGASWQRATAETAPGFSAVAYLFARELRRVLGEVPVGVIEASLGGTTIEAWTSTAMLRERSPHTLTSWEQTKVRLQAQRPALPPPPAVQRHAGSFTSLDELSLRHFKGPARLANGMLAPLAPYAMRGVLWYQGESDQGQAWRYRQRLAWFIEDLRIQWQSPDLFVALVLLPGYGRPDLGFTRELRDAQVHIHRTVAHTGLVNAADLGLENEVHPPDKRELARRAAHLVLTTFHGVAGEPTGPLFRSAAISDGAIEVAFDHVGSGLEVRGEALTGFMLAGADRVFKPAQAEIRGDRVIVRSPEVAQPESVRYAWVNTPRLTLWSRDGLPAAPFRSDDYRLTTNWRK